MSQLIITFPKDDTAFAAFVRSTIAALDARARVDPGQVQAALRRWHTRAQVRPQDALASLGDTTWYIYRDGHAGVRLEQDWWQADDVATARLGEDEVFVDGDDAACQLVDLPPGGPRRRSLAGARSVLRRGIRMASGCSARSRTAGRCSRSSTSCAQMGVDGSSNTGRSGSPDEHIYLCRWRELAVIDPGSTPTRRSAHLVRARFPEAPEISPTRLPFGKSGRTFGSLFLGSPDVLPPPNGRTRSGDAAADTSAAVVPRPTPVSSLLDELARAMQAAADRERERIHVGVGEEETAQVGKVHARAAAETEALQKCADDDVVLVHAWCEEQIRRIRAEGDRRIEDRRGQLEQSVTQHGSLIEAEIQSVHVAVQEYRDSLGAFFGRLAEERDASAIARLAGTLPVPPNLDEVRADARVLAMKALEQEAAETLAPDESSANNNGSSMPRRDPVPVMEPGDEQRDAMSGGAAVPVATPVRSAVSADQASDSPLPTDADPTASTAIAPSPTRSWRPDWFNS